MYRLKLTDLVVNVDKQAPFKVYIKKVLRFSTEKVAKRIGVFGIIIMGIYTVKKEVDVFEHKYFNC